MICATGSINLFQPSPDAPWDEIRIQHLLSRMGFGGSPATIESLKTQNVSDVVDNLLSQAIGAPTIIEPVWAGWNVDDYTDFDNQVSEQYLELTKQWVADMIQNPFRAKMSLFWSNHLVTKIEAYACPSYMYHYYQLLNEHGFGNFKTFIENIGHSPAMLLFLNGVQNTNFEPNENYARELYELFTLGENNGYTQNDIEETARALTGWNGFVKFCAPIGYINVFHDDGQKTIFGQTGNWNYEDVHQILFEERKELIAEHICRKLYAFYVNPEINEDIVSEMATTFINNDFEIVPVLSQLLKSEHFFDYENIGVRIKSPVECLISFITKGDFPYDDDVLLYIVYGAYLMGQQLFNPIDVAGWPEDKTWINSGTITSRWQYGDAYIFWLFQYHSELIRNFAIDISQNSIDPDFITQKITDHMMPRGLWELESYDQAITVFKSEVPQNYFDQGLWSLHWEYAPAQVALLFQQLTRQPEFQLC